MKLISARCLALFGLVWILFAPCSALAAQSSSIESPTKQDFQKQVDAEILRLGRIMDALSNDIMPPLSPEYEAMPKPQAPSDTKLPVAHANEAEILYARALRHLVGKGVPKDAAKAVGYLRQSANMDYAQAQYFLALCYAEGLDVPKDHREAVNWHQKAAEQGHAQAQYNLGWCYAEGLGVPKDHREAVQWYRKAAEQGVAGAQNNIGVSYYFGQGVSQNYREAVNWYRKAAGQEYKAAQFNLGGCYYNGQGLPKDEREALKWFKKAAEQGDTNALRAMALCNIEGTGIPRNTALGYTYLLLYKASSGNYNDLLDQESHLEKILTPVQKAESQQQARLMWEKIQAHR